MMWIYLVVCSANIRTKLHFPLDNTYREAIQSVKLVIVHCNGVFSPTKIKSNTYIVHLSIVISLKKFSLFLKNLLVYSIFIQYVMNKKTSLLLLLLLGYVLLCYM